MGQSHLLRQCFRYTVQLIHNQCDEMTTEESLLQPPFAANCMNWLIGHIISSRQRILQLVGEQPIWDDATRARYRFNSSPITALEEGVLSLDTLLSVLDATQEGIERGLAKLSDADLNAPSAGSGKATTLAEQLVYFHFHEAHHAGQIVTMGEFAGKKGAWLQ